MVRTKHTSQNIKSNESLSWRPPEKAPAKPTRQGISPSKFYGQTATSGHRRQRDNRLKEVLDDACTNAVRQQRREVTTRQKLQRSAYKDITCLQTWPLQDLAMKNLDELTQEYLFGDACIQQNQPEGSDAENGDSTGLSCSSFDEPKRAKPMDKSLSPRRSTLRNQYLRDFQQEKLLMLKRPSLQDEDEAENKDERETIDHNINPTIESFLPALWCMEPRIFAVEKSAQGKRKYIVGHLGRFFDMYWRKCDPKTRHYYELIRENTPCRLYFDLEFCKSSNPGISESDSKELLYEFFQELAQEIRHAFEISIDRSNIVDLDSSTGKKFSRHWIVHLPNAALFSDAGAAGKFVRSFVGRLAEEAATGLLKEKCPTLAQYLFVKTAPSKRSARKQFSQIDCNTQDQAQSNSAITCFVDLGVYTRNRLFRLLGSSKFGKPPSAALRIASTNEFPFPTGFDNESFFVPEMEKANAFVDKVEKENANMDLDMTKFMSAVDWTAHAEAIACTLVVPMNSSKLNFPLLPDVDTEATPVGQPSTQSTTLTSQPNLSQVMSFGSNSVGPSPYPMLDDFVTNVLGRRGGVEGAIRAWSLDSHASNGDTLYSTITYQMSRNRWCERIGRAHKSNNIMWTVDLQAMTCVQTCHDPECRILKFRGTPVPIPEDVLSQIQDVLFEEKLASMDDKELFESYEERTTENDDDEFDKALLNLDISGITGSVITKVNGESKDENQNQQQEYNEDSSKIAQGDLLSDSILLDAACSNPELFP